MIRVNKCTQREYSFSALTLLFGPGCCCPRSSAYMVIACGFFVMFTGTLFGTVLYAAGQRIAISHFENKDLSYWQEKKFAGKTDYTFVEDEKKGWVLKAYSHGTASGLVKNIQVDISKTPYLNWSWKVASLPEVGDEKTKNGDDYAARIYVIFKTGSWFWDTKALNYVWSSKYKVGDTWPNAFTSNACMVVVQSGHDKVGKWIEEKHNVKDDIALCFGITVDSIEAVALMSDSDNSKTEDLAYYSDIYFSGD
jgi:hypothetical protein